MSGPRPAGREGAGAADGGRPPLRPRQREKSAPCAAGCPNGTDVRGWIGLVAQRIRTGVSLDEALHQAWHRVVEVNPFPASLGRICPHPCQDGCSRTAKDGAVAIHALERFLGDWALGRPLSLPRRAHVSTGRSVGVVGAGPAGLSCGYQLARRGHRVTIYERSPWPGGMLRYGIPDYRLPPAVLNAEIRRILELGVELRTDVRVGRDVDLEALRSRHDALFLGIGAQSGRALGIPGEDGPGCWTGVDYLRRINLGLPAELGRRVAVIGGGNSAVDAARTALRQGAEEVTLLYRRTRAEMPAIEAEIEEMLREGVTPEFLVAPVVVQRWRGRVVGLIVQEMELGPVDGTGRRRPVPVEGSTRRMPVDGVVTAVSQVPDWGDLDGVRPDGRWLEPGADGSVIPGVWAGGDVEGLGYASLAVARGRRAAESIHAELLGLPVAPTDAPATDGRIGPSDVRADLYPTAEPVRPPALAPEEAVRRPAAETVATIGADDFLREADRCFSCGLCFGCRHCWMFCMASGFAPVARPGPGAYFSLTMELCESCGKCVDVCPCGYLEFDADA